MLEEEKVIHIDTFNSLFEKQRDFRVLVTTVNLWKYSFHHNGVALPRNSQWQNTALDLRSRASTSETLRTPIGKSLSYNLFFFFHNFDVQ